jgi:hypothetical protein
LGARLLGDDIPINALPCNGSNTTMNISAILVSNITEAEYFLDKLSDIETFEEVVDEIYNTMDHCE